MNAVGIDVPKGKSTVAILRPIDVSHDAVSMERLAYQILALGENTRVVMEATGRCHSFDPDSHLSGCFISHI